MKIEIITTPNSELKETGFGSLKSCGSVLDAVRKMDHSVKLTVCESENDLNNVVKRDPDLVILAVKYLSREGEDDIWLSRFFEDNAINFSGSLRDTLKFDSDKVRAKQHLRDNGIPTADFFTAVPGEYLYEFQLPFLYPLFLKPLDAANGNGVDDQSFVNNFQEFDDKIASLSERFEGPVLVEEYLAGREFTVSLIKTDDGELIVSPIEILPPQSTGGLRILGEKTKTDDSEELKKGVPSDLLTRVKKLAADAFVSLGIRDFGRIDIKTNEGGECFFMEANLVPGMTSGSSYFPRACEIASDLKYDEVIRIIVEKCLSRNSPFRVEVA